MQNNEVLFTEYTNDDARTTMNQKYSFLTGNDSFIGSKHKESHLSPSGGLNLGMGNMPSVK